jgi:hypothetical protein
MTQINILFTHSRVLWVPQVCTEDLTGAAPRTALKGGGEWGSLHLEKDGNAWLNPSYFALGWGGVVIMVALWSCSDQKIPAVWSATPVTMTRS